MVRKRTGLNWMVCWVLNEMQGNTENDVVLVWKLYVAFSYICSILSYVQESLLPWVHPGYFSLFFIGSIDAFVSVIPPSCVLLSVATLRSYQHISWFSGLSWKLIAVYIQCVHYCQICISFHSHNQVFILFVTLLILFANAVIVACMMSCIMTETCEVLKNSWVD